MQNVEHLDGKGERALVLTLIFSISVLQRVCVQGGGSATEGQLKTLEGVAQVAMVCSDLW